MAQIQDGSNGGTITTGARVSASRVWTGLYDANGNPIPKVIASNAASTDSGMPLSVLHDQRYQMLRGDQYGSVALATHQPLLSEYFDQAAAFAASNQKWLTSASGLTQSGTVAGGYNMTGSSTSAGAYSIIYTKRQFLKKLRTPLWLRAVATLQSVANSQCEIGFSGVATIPGTYVALTSGAYWVRDVAGAVYPVMQYNGGAPIAGTAVAGLTQTNYYQFDIVVDDDQAIFTISSRSTGNIISQQILRNPDAQGKNFNSVRLIAYARCFNSSATAPASSPTMILTEFAVGQLDVNFNYTAAELAAINGGEPQVNPSNGTATPNWTNSTAPTNATLSNTAAGYVQPGGRFGFAAVAGAATDYALFSYQVPYNFHIRGVYIDAVNTGAAVATTATTMQWALCNSTAVSLATAGATRRQLGVQYFPVGAAIGQQASNVPINRQFATPMVIPAGNYVTIILTMPVGTATASQVIQGIADIDGYYE